MPDKYFIRRVDKIVGPKTGQMVKQLIVNGRLIGDDEIAASEAGPWRPINEIAQLASLLPPQQTETAPSNSEEIESARRPTVVDIKTVEEQNEIVNDAAPITSSTIPKMATKAGARFGEQAANVGRKAQQLMSRSRKMLDEAVAEGKQRVVEAYTEAMSKVDETETLLLKDRLVLGRGTKRVDKVLPHPQVSLRHAMIEKNASGVRITDLGSASGTFVEGERIQRSVILQTGDTVSIGPYSLVFDGQNLVSESTIDNAELLCRDLNKTVNDRTTGQQITILNRVTLIAKPREFLVLLGPSGSGKSTLLNALSARSLATSGDVLLNGRNLYANFDALKKNISLVPQKDILHEDLRLRNALHYTARLRLPSDLKNSEINQITNDYLNAVDLGDRSDTYIRSLSGGQVKRASVANEIISQPNLLFIDEATSGLDEYTDGEIMEIFRRIAEDGKTVICITHNLTNVEKHCHRVAILAPGGYLAFAGTPAEAREYFEIVSLGQIYTRLKDLTGEQWRQRFEATQDCREMYKRVEEAVGTERPDISRTAKPSNLQHIGNFARQSMVLLRRGVELQWADQKSLVMLVGQCLFVAILIVMLFGDASLEGNTVIGVSQQETTSILFLLSISSFWFGCNNAAKEIVKEKSIYERERAVSLNVFSYYGAKLAFLTGITATQVTVLFIIVSGLTGLPGGTIAYFIALLCLSVCGVSLGLLISTLSSNTDVAATAVPIAVIPQVILSGMLGHVSGIAKLFACTLVSCYWGFGSVVSVIPEEIVVQPRSESLAEMSYFISIFIVVFHAFVLNAVAITYLYVSDKRWALKKSDLDAWMKSTVEVVANRTAQIRSHVESRIGPPKNNG